MIQDNKILVVGGMGGGKTTLIDALVGRKVLSGKATSEITCVYNEEEYDTPPVINNCDRFIGVKLSPNIPKQHVCFIDTPCCWNDISTLENLIRTNQINKILYVNRIDLVGTEYDFDLIKVLSKSKAKVIYCLTRCDDCDPEEDDIVQSIGWCKETLKDMLKEEQIHNPTILTVSPLNALLIKRKNNGEELRGYHCFVEIINEYPTFHLEKYCDNTIECQGNELLKHTGILNLETILYEER